MSLRDGIEQALLRIATTGLVLWLSGKIFRLGGDRTVEVAGNVFNVLNAGGFHQFTYSTAWATYSPNFLQMRSRQNPRAFQLTLIGRF